jgi:hypothetical protein
MAIKVDRDARRGKGNVSLPLFSDAFAPEIQVPDKAFEPLGIASPM